MKMAYKTEEQISEQARKVGQKIARLLVEEGLTYQEADDALSCAQKEMLLTVPTFLL